MRRSLIALTIALTAALAACSSSSEPGWTYAPPTEPPAVTPAPSGEASAPPSAPASAAPSGEASGSGGPSSAPSDGGGGASSEAVAISAMGIKFEQAEVTAPADAPFVIRFDNKDAGIPHNVEIKDASGGSVFKGEIFNGAAVKDYQVPALAAGTYQFICTVHPNMVGTLTVGG